MSPLASKYYSPYIANPILMYILGFHNVSWILKFPQEQSKIECCLTYSSVPNRRACTFINFEEKIPPARPYLALHVYCFWEKNPPARLFFCVYKGICPARLLILRKKSPLHGLISVCTFIDFEKKIPPARLFHTARLFPTAWLLIFQKLQWRISALLGQVR